jgi:hypothetical protein
LQTRLISLKEIEMRDHSVESDMIWYLGELNEEERKEFFAELFERFCRLCSKELDEEQQCYCDPAFDE